MLIPLTAQKILDATSIELKLDRMSFQVLELTYENDEIVILGIEPGGGLDIAKIIGSKIEAYDPSKKMEFSSICINKQEPLKENIFIKDSLNLNNKTVLIIDDVGNTGRTLFYALQPLTHFYPKKIIIAVLVDRTHKTFPINADIVGFPIATTLNEHIIVKIENEKVEGAYLF
ncbi:MAG TPA: phosphoribosyltransferase family protein [Chitinophagales bacterium]|jgi:pyrimidine operon attenuation protein/uracil phosphoribosyltransferase|nr:phosphoribosyltransferase [Chitinophagales bacterium]MBP6153487.1 phosphoribosyltransferase [Chitinophagales bacterium]HQV78607.1 phosphoribosyltransferase family protein [Chitinophagales bacterium]HQW79007.1 phosphoribosyltransferase family protein [Chitinophagales bacterium]HRB67651.1 phosphoribosyltransferase family protein [Chitinophagales bacterium]